MRIKRHIAHETAQGTQTRTHTKNDMTSVSFEKIAVGMYCVFSNLRLCGWIEKNTETGIYEIKSRESETGYKFLIHREQHLADAKKYIVELTAALDVMFAGFLKPCREYGKLDLPQSQDILSMPSAVRTKNGVFFLFETQQGKLQTYCDGTIAGEIHYCKHSITLANGNTYTYIDRYAAFSSCAQWLGSFDEIEHACDAIAGSMQYKELPIPQHYSRSLFLEYAARCCYAQNKTELHILGNYLTDGSDKNAIVGYCEDLRKRKMQGDALFDCIYTAIKYEHSTKGYCEYLQAIMSDLAGKWEAQRILCEAAHYLQNIATVAHN